MKICDKKYGLNGGGSFVNAIADVVEEGNPELIACRVTAEAMYGAVRKWGSDSYNGGQEWSKNNCIK
jgi:hypothetical protein